MGARGRTYFAGRNDYKWGWHGAGMCCSSFLVPQIGTRQKLTKSAEPFSENFLEARIKSAPLARSRNFINLPKLAVHWFLFKLARVDSVICNWTLIARLMTVFLYKVDDEQLI
jgi:hypothetical protein